MRISGAFVVAVIVAAAIFVLGFVIPILFYSPGDLSGAFSGFLWMITASTVVGLFVALAGGVPLWLLMEHRGISSRPAYVSAGAFLASATYLLFFGIGVNPIFMASTLLAGGCGGYVFWRIAIRPAVARELPVFNMGEATVNIADREESLGRVDQE